MSKRIKVSAVLDAVLADAVAVTQRKQAEHQAIKVAAAEPRSELARDIRKLAQQVRALRNDVSYSDIGDLS